MKRLTSSKAWEEARNSLGEEPGYLWIWQRLNTIEDILGDDYGLDRLRELVEADREDAVHIGACGFCEYYQMDKFCCCPDWVEDGYAVIRKPKDYCTKFKKAGWVDEVWGENGCPSCLGYKPEKAEQEGRT